MKYQMTRRGLIGLGGGAGGAVLLGACGDDGPNPVALFLHSGGFVSGDKSKGVNEHFEAVLDAGWDIVAVNYRLAVNDGSNLWPVPLLDVNTT